jgi:dihydrofolate reductase
MPKEFKYKAIAAMAQNRVIGHQGTIPWHLTEDFKWFKKVTLGHTLLMGRKTFESIGRTLPGRQTLILSRNEYSADGALSIHSPEEAEAVSENELIWIAGGAEIYKMMLPKCSELFLTRVHKEPEGDTFFPEFEDQFHQIDTLESNDDFTIEHWQRKP